MPRWIRPLSLATLAGLWLTAPLAWSQEPPKAPPTPPEKTEKTDKTDKAAKKVSTIKIIVAEDDADVFIEDKLMKTGTGTKREYKTPPLADDTNWAFKITSKTRPNNYTEIIRTREVTFEAGQTIEVDLTKESPTDKAIIRYVPTPDDIVKKMIELAKITPADVVFEPGCGDARIVTAAVKAGAKKGVGIDLDPERIKESKETVAAAKLGDKVDIRLGDALDIKDFSEASVVFLYMGNEFDMLIRPVLWKSLKVGTRIVSHRFLMGDWKPEKTLNIKGEDGEDYEVHLWTITQEVKDKAAAMAKPKDAKPADKAPEKAPEKAPAPKPAEPKKPAAAR